MRFRIRLTVGTLALAFAPTLALAQAAIVTGRVTAADRGAVSDVAVTIPALGVGAVTSDDGRYTITIPGAATISISSARPRCPLWKQLIFVSSGFFV